MQYYLRSFSRFFAPVLISLVVSSCNSLSHSPSDAQLKSNARHITLEGQSNFRDLGGYKTTDGRTVKWGQVFRTGELGQLSDKDVEKLAELDLQTMVNFLLPEEIEKHGVDRLPEGVNHQSESISGEQAAQLTMQAQSAISSGDFEKLPLEMNPEFHRLLVEEGKDQYSALLRAAADPKQRPLAFHCSHGVHRTGTASALLLSVLGVPWETVQEDYLLSNKYRKEEIESALAKIRMKVAASRGVDPKDVDMTNVEGFYILKKEYIDGSLQAIKENYGSMDAYIQDGLGLSEVEIESLRSSMLE